jgi:hypothetical protein
MLVPCLRQSWPAYTVFHTSVRTHSCAQVDLNAPWQLGCAAQLSFYQRQLLIFIGYGCLVSKDLTATTSSSSI